MAETAELNAVLVAPLLLVAALLAGTIAAARDRRLRERRRSGRYWGR